MKMSEVDTVADVTVDTVVVAPAKVKATRERNPASRALAKDRVAAFAAFVEAEAKEGRFKLYPAAHVVERAVADGLIPAPTNTFLVQVREQLSALVKEGKLISRKARGGGFGVQNPAEV